MNPKLSWRPRGAFILACLATALLTACGGGGGSTGPAGGDTTSPVTPSGSGLLPAAVSSGATLAEDASVWRPLRDKASYRYRGRHSVPGGTEADSTYENTVTQLAQGTGMREDASNAFNEGTDTGSAPVQLQSGSIIQQQPFQFAAGSTAINLEYVELRSPVRANDRYVVVDRRIADLGTDLDGDKKNDGLDVAIWVQVAGDEVVDLPNRKGLRTIRTEATVRARAVLSTTGSTGPTVETRLTVWYAAGIGPVKVKRDAPHPTNDKLRVIDEETLVTYDGLTEGLGYTPLALMSLTTGGSGIPLAYGAAGFDNHVVALSNLPDTFPAAGFMLTQLDARGAVTAATPYTAANIGEAVYTPRILRMGNELRMVYLGSRGISMLRFSADGKTLLSPAPVTLVPGPLGSVSLTTSGDQFLAAASDSALWVVTTNAVDSSTRDQARLELRRFNTDGLPVGTPRALESGENVFGVLSLSMAASARHLVLLWYRPYLDPSPHHLVIDVATGAAAPATATNLPSELGPACQTQGLPVTLNASDLILCGTGGGGVPGVLTLSDTGLPVTAADGSLHSDSLLPADWPLQSPLSLVVDAQRLSFFNPRTQKLYPEDSLETSFQQFGEVPLHGGRVDASGLRVLARVPSSVLWPSFSYTLGNRILVVGTDCQCQTGKMGTLVVWR